MKMQKTIVWMAILAIVMMGCGSQKKESQKSVSLSGAGATFPEPFYTVAIKDYYKQSQNVVSYGGVGSGGGINSLKEGVVDFAGSDAFLTDEEQKDMLPVVHIPTCMGAVVLAYNLPGIANLNLTGEVVAKIYSGDVSYWDDPVLCSLNEGVKLPHTRITPVYRSEGSGTTFVFTDYLSKVSPAWESKFGRGKQVDFPAGVAAKGNPGVAGVVGQTEGSIGYVGSEYAFAQKLSCAAIQNLNGEFVTPSTASVSAAAQGDIPADTRCMIVNSSAPGAYPISLFTWIIVYKDLNNGKRTEDEALAVKDFLKFILSEDMQAKTEQLHFAPLPEKVRKQALKIVESIQYIPVQK